MLVNKKKKESRVKFNPGLSARNRPSNNWAQIVTIIIIIITIIAMIIIIDNYESRVKKILLWYVLSVAEEWFATVTDKSR